MVQEQPGELETAPQAEPQVKFLVTAIADKDPRKPSL